MKSYRLPVLSAVAFAVACGAASNPDVAAKAGNQQLSTARLAEILGQSQAPLEKDVARSIAELWLNYQLVGVSAAKGDSLNDPKVMQDALWSNIDNIRVKKFYDAVSAGWADKAPGTDEERYNSGEAFAARHILVKTDPGATPEQKAAAKTKAEGILKEATTANFVALTAKSDEPNAKERGGDLGLFGRGMMVPEFEKCVIAIKVGELSKEVCETSFGYHVIYRSPFKDVAAQFAPIAKQRNVAIAESTYLATMESANAVKIENNAAVKAKAIAKNPFGYTKDNDAIASFKGGKLTAARLSQWVSAYPPQSQIRPQLAAAPDSLVEKFIHQIVRNELVLRQADSAKFQVDTAEMSNLFLNFKNDVVAMWNQLGVDPSKLVDSTGKAGDKEKIAGAKIDDYFAKLIKNEVPLVEVPYKVSRALQQKYPYSINESGLDAVIEKAKSVRATADSLRAQQAPPAGAPAGPPGAPPAPDTTKK
ncbi:MAG: peptidylprolyl isomerase [Gemmatimonadaceae bacterium]|nr:peptidylprolyl isomerase [Gemmatimonadaceae bacterium]